MSSTRIRRPRLEDVDALHEAVAESVAEISRWMSWCGASYSREDARAWLAEREAAWTGDESYDFVVEDDGGRLLGAIGVNAIDFIARRANLGYWIRTTAAGRGHATAACELLIEYVFSQTQLNRLEIIVAIENHRSHRVAQKLGAVREGVLRERLWPQGEPQDVVMYSILRSDRERPN